MSAATHDNSLMIQTSIVTSDESEVSSQYAGTDAWSREARAIVRLAEEAGITLDHERLLLADVRDLQAARRQLRQTICGGTHPRLDTRVYRTIFPPLVSGMTRLMRGTPAERLDDLRLDARAGTAARH